MSMIDEEDEFEPEPLKSGMPFQHQLMEWGLIALVIGSLIYFFVVIVF